MAESMMDRTISAILTAFVAVILIASAFIPTAMTQVNSLIAQFTTTSGGTSTVDPAIAGYASLIGVVITVTIVGIIIGIVKSYSDRNSYGDRD